jgi:hypothetical protein
MAENGDRTLKIPLQPMLAKVTISKTSCNAYLRILQYLAVAYTAPAFNLPGKFSDNKLNRIVIIKFFNKFYIFVNYIAVYTASNADFYDFCSLFS